jgi:hypothetical protein
LPFFMVAECRCFSDFSLSRCHFRIRPGHFLSVMTWECFTVGRISDDS